MEHGADARQGIYPHRDATSALTLAAERGYGEIVAIIEEEERRRQAALSGPHAAVTPAADELTEAVESGDEARAIGMLEADPALIHACNRGGWTPLAVAAAMRSKSIVSWLLERGADVNRRGPGNQTPLDRAVGRRWREPSSAQQFAAVAGMLRHRGAELTARSAVALGEAAWLRARHAQGALVNPVDWKAGGLLTVAVKHDRPDMLALLLDLGFDPDERVRLEDLEEAVYSQCLPLWCCAATGKLAMAKMLLERGADPNGHVYASGSPVYSAYSQRDWAMVDLLRRYGGRVGADTAAHYRQTEVARQMLADADAGRLPEGMPTKEALVQELLWSAACGGDPEIVRMALERVDWPRDDPRWYWVLEQPLRIWNHMDGPWANPALDRATYPVCFRLVLQRCDPNMRHPRFGRVILHDVAASREYVTPEEASAFVTILLDAGARLDVRDDLLRSTPLGWACRWGRAEVARLLLERGADPVEADAEPWATPRAWATKMGHAGVLRVLREYGG
jgi:ankyrin repeat protein